MMEATKGAKITKLPVAPERSLCYGCERYGRNCVHTYHREIEREFREQTGTDAIQSGLRIDKKHRKELMEKRIALGHRPDDHEDYMMKM